MDFLFNVVSEPPVANMCIDANANIVCFLCPINNNKKTYENTDIPTKDIRVKYIEYNIQIYRH